MIFFHLDRSKTLLPNMVVDLQQVHPQQAILMPHMVEMQEALFPDGLSQFGISHIRDDIFIFGGQTDIFFPMPLDQFTDYNSRIKEYLRESTYEYIRRLYFPNMPSRFQCVFRVEKEVDIQGWSTMLLDSNIGNIVMLEAPDNQVYEFDESYLFNGLVFPTDTNSSSPYAMSVSLMYQNAMNYWQQKRTETPRIELLVKLPANVLSVKELGS